MKHFNLPPVPLEEGKIDEATRGNVKVVIDEFIRANPLLRTLTLNE